MVGLVGVELAPLRRCLEKGEAGHGALYKEVRVDQQTLKNAINGLKKTRDVCSSQLDIGALTELDGVIASLEKLHDHPQYTAEAEAQKLRVLKAIAAFVSIAANLRDWLK